MKHVSVVRAYSGKSHESPPEGLHKGPSVISRQELKKISEHLAGDLGMMPKNLPNEEKK
jgi:hypothetical protein